MKKIGKYYIKYVYFRLTKQYSFAQTSYSISFQGILADAFVQSTSQ